MWRRYLHRHRQPEPVWSVRRGYVPIGRGRHRVRCVPGGQLLLGARRGARRLQPRHVCRSRRPEHVHAVCSGHLPVVRGRLGVRRVHPGIVLHRRRKWAHLMSFGKLPQPDGAAGRAQTHAPLCLTASWPRGFARAALTDSLLGLPTRVASSRTASERHRALRLLRMPGWLGVPSRLDCARWVQFRHLHRHRRLRAVLAVRCRIVSARRGAIGVCHVRGTAKRSPRLIATLSAQLRPLTACLVGSLVPRQRGYYCPRGSSTPVPCPGGTIGSFTGLASSSQCTPVGAQTWAPMGSSSPQFCP